MFTCHKPVARSYGGMSRRRVCRSRRGGILIWCALLLMVMIGMVGLVVDGGRMMAGHRNVHNAADAAAMAAAMDLFRGASAGDAAATGATFVTGSGYNDLPNATVAINIPPSTGPYAGLAKFAEALVSDTSPTYFIQVLPGMSSAGSAIHARAVAGSEQVPVGAGVMALDPNEEPGINVTGNGQVCVAGAVFVNSLGGGENEWGENIGNGQVGAAVSNNATLCATETYVAGGVNDLNNFDGYPAGAEPKLDAGTGVLYPDPLAGLPTPKVANGVINIDRGSPQATSGGLQLNNPNDLLPEDGGNFIENLGTPDETMVLHPGIYKQIKVTGGKVRFVPGIYVLRPPSSGNISYTLDVSGGEVIADGVMFYNTCSDYNPDTGLPDENDDGLPPPSGFPPPGVKCGDTKINASMGFSPITSGPFEGMLFYFRRWHTGRLQIEGNSADGDLTGTLYAKWGEGQISGQGTYNAQFLVGHLSVSGQGNITIDPNDDFIVQVTKVFLVE